MPKKYDIGFKQNCVQCLRDLKIDEIVNVAGISEPIENVRDLVKVLGISSYTLYKWNREIGFDLDENNEKGELAERTIRLFKSIGKRLLKDGLTIELAYQLSDTSLMRKIDYRGTQRSFQALRCNINAIYKLTLRFDETKKKLREKARQYRENNKERYKQYSKLYRENNREKLREKARQYREANKEKCKQYYETNKEKLKQNREANKERIKQYGRRYYETNKERIKQYGRQYSKQYYEANKRKGNYIVKLIKRIGNYIVKLIKRIKSNIMKLIKRERGYN